MEEWPFRNHCLQNMLLAFSLLVTLAACTTHQIDINLSETRKTSGSLFGIFFEEVIRLFGHQMLAYTFRKLNLCQPS